MRLWQRIQTAGHTLRRVWRFVMEDVWDLEVTSLSRTRNLAVRLVRVVHLVFKGFYEDECPLHASALTFSTLMSIVPVLAVSLALARGFGADEAARRKVMEAVEDWTRSFATQSATEGSGGATREESAGAAPGAPGRPAGAEDFDTTQIGAQIRDVVEQGFEKVENISFTALGGLALVLLIWMVISVLGRVEGSFNRVWGVTVNRRVWRKFTDYLSILIILPILMAAATSLPVADLAARFLGDSNVALLTGLLDSPFLRRTTVIAMTTLCFGFLIMFMPNTRVKPDAGLAGGFVTALLFIGWMALCAAIQVGAARYGRIYGSFAIIPILLAWVYVSWQIVLFGAEVAFAVQNCETYRMEQGAEQASFRTRAIVALSLVVEAARNMLEKEGWLDVTAYARDRRVPVRLLHDVVADLSRLRIFAAVGEDQDRYVLLKAPGHYTVAQFLDALKDLGVPPEALGLDRVEARIRKVVEQALREDGEGETAVTIWDLARGSGT